MSSGLGRFPTPNPCLGVVKGSHTLFRHPLSREIAAALVFKVLFLTALYFAFFATPPSTVKQTAEIFGHATPSGAHEAGR